MSNASHRVRIPRVRKYHYDYKPIPFQYEFEELGMSDCEKNYLRNTSSASDSVSKEGESLPAAEDIYCFTCRKKVDRVDGRHVGGKEPWYDLPVNDEPRNAWTCSSECHETYNHVKYVMNRK
jgi:hypothetical protein